jgi:3-oxoacyl-[acyl-carrier-protein] synthase-1
VKCSSTKGITGHTLGAAGITEAIICSLVLQHDILPANINLKSQDPDLAIKVLEKNSYSKVANVMTNSFGFGGSNCSLVFGW